ncbi:2-oxo-4-hydroxy-4-carboxy-5-ureidoimidazoline decarboxylase [Terriglobus albidus]|uniref:2-oxo-4-hydroxy-4-carboxy-5-ureidoimidazoline decarboxylase n=1 Tax=Terriglobus albidus TaxID=1592106 RepID=A0A5B9E511_9BACT|nr:2-oxo-4-hydroxy-4-carboxy-5-ureidoimidazoline decarboxylase [Terriglobus albidus]QEE26654.1 2-oxo-4-hydroxy-4-carboxy-5-ureidoimidazoline decarboxylase [Terriglobus albidus]
MNPVLDHWNALPADQAKAEILPANGSHEWAEQMVSHRPYPNEQTLFEVADHIWYHLDADARQQAFDSHPRIGQRHAAKEATEKSLAWSSQEQTLSDDERLKQELAEANKQYEEKFDRIFIVCATGKTQQQMLEILRQRLNNDDETEFAEAAEQQRQITQLRLRKWLAGN